MYVVVARSGVCAIKVYQKNETASNYMKPVLDTHYTAAI